jgi:starch synthase
MCLCVEKVSKTATTKKNYPNNKQHIHKKSYFHGFIKKQLMIEVLHIAAECYPAAKAGGLGDVVGALPKYQNQSGLHTAVVMPKYGVSWFAHRRYSRVMQGEVRLHYGMVWFSIELVEDTDLGFPLYVVDIPGKFDRDGIYIDPTTGHGYWDEVERNLCFQQAILIWLRTWQKKPYILHCHDHHTALIPFMVRFCPEYAHLDIPTIFTIHNGNYSGAFSWDKINLLPFFDADARGLLDWDGMINPLAAAVKTAWAVTTVSSGYMEELKHQPNSLSHLFNQEWRKCKGILNGIDTEIWDPAIDPSLASRFAGNVADYKAKNKAALSERFNIDASKPLITFIGRFAAEKGADILHELIGTYLSKNEDACFVILGSGDTQMAKALNELKQHFAGRFDIFNGYNEALAHQLYAGADFLLMPSRLEPCGLNQLYAFRYGTIPIVHGVGGLHDTVTDMSEMYGRGVRFDDFSFESMRYALHRAVNLYQNTVAYHQLVQKNMLLDFSWHRSANEYTKLYEKTIP